MYRIRHSLPIEGNRQPKASNYTKRLLYDGSSGHADTTNRYNSNSNNNNIRSQPTALSLPRHSSSGSGGSSKRGRNGGGSGGDGGEGDEGDGMIEESFCVLS